MKTALDASIILNVLTDDALCAGSSDSGLVNAQTLGQLIIVESTLARNPGAKR